MHFPHSNHQSERLRVALSL
uniref:Uncharacterized protein n=1 Tax=Anopheles quadriannulatus TaxID=34691 RepID=A0A182XSH9_ANOQN